MNLLGIDFGLKKIGLAFFGGYLVETIGSIEVKQQLLPLKKNSRIVKEVKRICQENKIDKIILGLPDGRIKNKVIEFAEQLSVYIDKPIEFFDESLTTQEAIVKMVESGRGQKYRREKKDAVAAAVILENYLTSLNV